MKIAVEGCAHGELEKIYNCLEILQGKNDFDIDLLICCGDFQSTRNEEDMMAMAVPPKFRQMCSFYKYYAGILVAPVLTIFIGGNHEASNYLQELPYGGWVAPNIYYLGRAGVVQFGNLRIGGLSGIFKGQDYLQGLWECVPYTPGSLRSVYHVRALDTFRLSQLKEKVHIMLSHDWPQGITEYGDKENLLRRKPFLREDVESNKLGSSPSRKLLMDIKPDYWFAAHLHCQFVGLVKHDDGKETKFLALDKCLPKRRHLQIIDLPEEYDGDKTLKHDAEWLAILKNTNHLMTVKNVDSHMPGPGGHERYDFTPTEGDKQAVIKAMSSMVIDKNSFVRTTSPGVSRFNVRMPKAPKRNPQTVAICEKLGIDDPVEIVMARAGRNFEELYYNDNVMYNYNRHSCGSECQESSLDSTDTTTPNRSKMSLPTPKTNNDTEDTETSLKDTTTVMSPESTSVISESVCSSTAACSTPATPASEGPKKTFKRRNLAMYTPDADESITSTSSSVLEPESPVYSKFSRDT